MPPCVCSLKKQARHDLSSGSVHNLLLSKCLLHIFSTPGKFFHPRLEHQNPKEGAVNCDACQIIGKI